MGCKRSNAESVKHRYYPFSLIIQKHIDEALVSMLASGVFEKFESLWDSLIDREEKR